jgi:hypothetical protein
MTYPVKIDVGDIFAEGMGFLVKQVFLFCLAVWTGCCLGGFSFIAASLAFGGGPRQEYFQFLLISPVLLLTAWLLPNILFLGITGCRLVIYSESTGLRTWACLIGGEALFSMAAVMNLIPEGEWQAKTLAWVCCLALIVMMGTAFWYYRAWQLNRWSTELVGIQAENVVRRAELKEEFGTESSGVDGL